jgi:hypothetical protein
VHGAQDRIGHRVERGCAGRNRRELAGEPFDRQVEFYPQQVALGLEVVEEGVATDAGAARDLVDGGGRVGLFQKEFGRRIFQNRSRRGARATPADARLRLNFALGNDFFSLSLITALSTTNAHYSI